MSATCDGISRWSEPVNGLCGRVHVEFEELDSGPRHATYLELRNETAQPIVVTNVPDVHPRLHDAAGGRVETSAVIVSGPEPSRRWMVVPPDAYLGFRIDLRSAGAPTKESGTELLALGGDAWRLGAGRYELRVTAAFPRAPDGPAEQWVGELELPPVAVVVELERAG